MAHRTSAELAADMEELGLKGKVVGVHSNLVKLGIFQKSAISEQEQAKGLSPMAKTIVNGLVEGVGPEGTVFVPSHSLNLIKNGEPINGYYDPETSPSTVGALPQAFIWDDRAVRSPHPSHSTTAIGPEAEYLAKGHTMEQEPVGLYNAFAKLVGLDGVMLFAGETLKSNTTFHAYETLMTPCAGPNMGTRVGALIDGKEVECDETWAPGLHREFYKEMPGKYETRSFKKMREAGLLHEGKLGRSKAYYYFAKETARFFAEEVFPSEPDIMLCAGPETCGKDYSCETLRGYMRPHLCDADGNWDSEKVKEGMNKEFLALMEPGVQRLGF